jgi:asparagine synthase (glutamine-hydrolysing)
VESFDEPFADSSAIPTFLVARLAREHVKVALSGEGGDELFGGYNYYSGHALARRLALAARIATPIVRRLPSSSAKASTLEYRAKRFVAGAHLPPLERHSAWKEITPGFMRERLLRPEHRVPAEPADLLRTHFAETVGAEPLARVMDIDLRIFLVDDMLVKTDRASMAHSLEARVPFLDTAVSDLALSLPVHMKVRGFSKKRLIRRAIAPLVPDEIIRGKKQGFSIPVAAWLRGELAPLAREVLSPGRVQRQGFFRPDAVTALLEEHLAGRDRSRQVWALLVFSLWHDRWAQNGAAA